MVSGLNQSKAAFKAGFAADTNCTESAPSKGSKLMDEATIIARIDELRAKRLEKYNVTGEKLIQEAAFIAFFDPRKLFDEDGKAKDITELDDATAAAVAQGSCKPADKLAAIQLLMREKGMLKDNMDMTTKGQPIKALISVDIDEV